MNRGTFSSRCRSSLLVLGFLAAARLASADASSAREQARAQFKEGLRHVQHGELAAAIEAFESAYWASPNYAVLYDLGQAYAAVGRRADAVHAFERFLAEGGDRVDAERTRVVLELIARERAKLSHLELEVSPVEAEVFLDGRRLEQGAGETRDLDAGAHLLVVSLDGYRPALSHLELAPGESTRLTVALEREPLQLVASPSAAASHSGARGPESLPPGTESTLRTSNGKKERVWAVGVGAGSLVLAGTAVGLFVWNTARYQTWQSDRAHFDAQLANGSSGPSMVSQSHGLTERAVGIQRVDDLAIGSAVAAGAALATAALFWLTSAPAKPAPPPMQLGTRSE